MKFEGVYAIMTTPFNASGKIDFAALREKTEFLLACGMDGLVPTGSVGECSALTDNERVEIWEAVRRVTGSRAAVIGSTIHTATGHATRLAEEARSLGLDAVMNMPPYYWALTDDTIVGHYQALSQAVDIPIMAYNNANVTRVDMSPSLIARIADIPNVKALKETTHRLLKLEQVFHAAGDRIAVLNGMTVFHEPYATIMGCPGMVDPFANFLGPTTVAIRKYAEEGDYEKALELKQTAVAPIANYLFSMPSVPHIIAAYKHLEQQLGLMPCAYCRPPIFDISDQVKADLNELLEVTKPFRMTV